MNSYVVNFVSEGTYEGDYIKGLADDFRKKHGELDKKIKRTKLDTHKENRLKTKKSNLKEAIKQKPDNILASIKLSEIITGIGSKSTSIKHLEKTFLLTSHPDDLDSLAKEWGDKTPGARVAKSIKLLSNKYSPIIEIDLKIEIACYAIKEKIWGEAEKILSEID